MTIRRLRVLRWRDRDVAAKVSREHVTVVSGRDLERIGGVDPSDPTAFPKRYGIARWRA